jgi:ABC-type glycerol-3-phosphate transport system permease component
MNKREHLSESQAGTPAAGAVSPAADRATTRRRAERRMFWSGAGLLALLTLVAVTLVLPFVWMILTSLKPLDETALEGWLPTRVLWSNYLEVFRVRGVQFGRWYWNSIFVASWVTALQVFTSSLAAFSFARLRWPGRDKVFLLYLATMMLPGLVMMIPNYQLMIRLGLVDSYLGLILPAAFSAFGTFLLRQFMLSIPFSLDEAASIDGASHWQVYWQVILPLARPGLIALAIFTFIGNYHSFFWPLVMLKSTHRYTLPVGLLFFDSSLGQQTNLLMAGITMSVLPLLAVFVLLQRHLISGIQLGAVKG